MFRVTLCPSSGADDLEVFIRCVAEPCLCRQSDPVGCLSVHWEALNTTLLLLAASLVRLAAGSSNGLTNT